MALFVALEFYPFRGRVLSLQPPVTRAVRRFFRDRFSVLLNLSFLNMGSPFYGLKTKRRLTCGSSRNSLAQKNLLFPRQAKAFPG
jgi:hypothetical protein